MPYFLSAENLATGKEMEMSGEEARHVLLSHRVKVGEKIKLQGPDGKRYLADVKSIGKHSLKATPTQELVVPPEPKTKITLFQSVVSEKALDFIFQKGTELGLDKIVLFNSKNTAAKLSRDLFEKKQERWSKILIEAAKQSERAAWPQLEFSGDVEGVIKIISSFGKVVLTDISGAGLAFQPPLPLSMALLVGPEGGFTQEEVLKFQGIPNVQTASLGHSLLRADTAALAALAICRNALN